MMKEPFLPELGKASRYLWHLIAWASLTFAQAGWTQEVVPGKRGGVTAADQFAKRIQPMLRQYCSKCHEKEKPKGDFSIGDLTSSLKTDQERDRWATTLERIRAGEMPPKDQVRPSADEAKFLTGWIEEQLRQAGLDDRKNNGRTVLRRLNRNEYENTICDLLSIKIHLKELLALDGSDGFDNVGSALHVSSFALERYLEAGDKALKLAIANTPRPALIKKRYDLKQQHSVKGSQEDVFRHLKDAVVLLSSSPWTNAWLSEFYPPDGGQFRIRVSTSAFQSGDKPVTYRVASGELRGKEGLIGYFDAHPGPPRIAEVVVHLEPRSGMSVLPYGLPGSNVIVKAGADKYTGPGVAVQWLEIEGPLHDSWPPASHKNLFGDLPRKPFPSHFYNNYHEVVSDVPAQDARIILARFLPKAFRRAVTDDDIKPYLKLFQTKLDQGLRFEEAVRVALLGALVSDDFLFLRENPGPLDHFALASRLSYFLWSSMPDEELFKLAESQRLRDPATLRQQVERMLSDSKAAAFTENFVGQWLNLRNIDATEPNYLLYPEFDHMLKVSMIRETELFFAEVLKHDLSLTCFIDSDFSMLNGRLARHYGIPGPEGWEFQKVALPKNSHRGGVLTMASVLKVTANGSYTHPVHRGVWVLDRILGKRPPNPPANVPVVEPDVRGAKGIRDLLARHRSGTCASCHIQIDPPGFALESFDVIGGWRDHYRTTGLGKEVKIDGKRMHFLSGPKVECSDELPDGRKFQNIDEYKQLLLSDKDQLARTLVKQLVTYATGASPQAEDQEQIEKLVAEIRGKNYGLRSLIHAIVQSSLFQNK